MILYSDEYTKRFEFEGKWLDSIGYLYEKWTVGRENISLFLKFSFNIWYTLTLDGCELSLKKKEYDILTQMLCDCLEHFKESFAACEDCQWIFGYMMEVRTDLFLSSKLEYNTIEKIGKALIEKASDKGNIFAQLLFARDNCSKENIERKRKKVKESISKYFDNSQETDQYFIEILTMEVE